MEPATDFVNLSEKNLKHFLAKDELDVGELELFRGVVKLVKKIYKTFNKNFNDFHVILIRIFRINFL
jgi:hypothetical protein